MSNSPSAGRIAGRTPAPYLRFAAALRQQCGDFATPDHDFATEGGVGPKLGFSRGGRPPSQILCRFHTPISSHKGEEVGEENLCLTKIRWSSTMGCIRWRFVLGELTELLETWDEVELPGVEEAPALTGFKDVTSILVAGVYVLLFGIIIVYVGQARCLAVRIGQHREQGKIKFDSAKIFPCEHRGRRNSVEKSLIKKFNPKYNVRHNEYGKPKKRDIARPDDLIPLSQLMARRRGLVLVVNNEAPMRRF
jgi:hypothetical protein